MKTITNTNALEQARALTQPTCEASLNREPSVSQFWNNNRKLLEAYGQHLSPVEKGVNILYDLATSDAYKDAAGKYFDNDKAETIGRFSPAHPDAYDEVKISELLATTNSII